MPDSDDRLDQRLRAALIDLDDAAQQRVRPPAAATVSAAGRRRRTAFVATAAVLVLALAGGLSALWFLRAPAGEQNAGPNCRRTGAAVYMASDITAEQREHIGTVLRGYAEVGSVTYESRDTAYDNFRRLYADHPDRVDSVQPEMMPDSWRFTLRCADIDVVRARLMDVPGVDEVFCVCEARLPSAPVSIR